MDLAVMLIWLLESLLFWDIEDARDVDTAWLWLDTVRSFRSSYIEKYLSIDLLNL